jgi:hypothetical protein
LSDGGPHPWVLRHPSRCTDHLLGHQITPVSPFRADVAAR